MTREGLSPKALEMLNAHNLDEVFITSDGQGFTERHRAEAHASILKNKKIEHFVKSKEAVQSQKSNDESLKEDEDDHEDKRPELVAKYELLFNKKPAHNIGIEKLKAQISEKEAELAQAQTATVQDATQSVQTSTEGTETVENPTEENQDLKED